MSASVLRVYVLSIRLSVYLCNYPYVYISNSLTLLFLSITLLHCYLCLTLQIRAYNVKLASFRYTKRPAAKAIDEIENYQLKFMNQQEIGFIDKTKINNDVGSKIQNSPTLVLNAD